MIEHTEEAVAKAIANTKPKAARKTAYKKPKGSTTTPGSENEHAAYAEVAVCARNAIIAVFALGIIVIGALVTIEWASRDLSRAAHDSDKRIARIMAEIRGTRAILDDKLQVIARTGNEAQINRFHSRYMTLDGLLAELGQIVSTQNMPADYVERTALRHERGRGTTIERNMLIDRFFMDISTASTQLKLSEMPILDLARDGRMREAVVHLNVPLYAQQKADLQASLDRMEYEFSRMITSRVYERTQQETLFLGSLLAAAVLCAAVLWRYLSIALSRSLVSARQNAERIRALQWQHPVSHFPNAEAFAYRLEQALAQTEAQAETEAEGGNGEWIVLSVDMGGQRDSALRLGKDAAQYFLTETARRMRVAILAHEGAIIGHLDTSTFGVALPARDRDSVIAAAERLQKTLSMPIDFDGELIPAACTIGCAVYPDDSRTAASLVRRAELASSNATKDQPVEFFHHSVEDAVQNRFKTITEIENGIRLGEFVPYFQPFIDLHDGTISGFEVLARWNHPQHGVVTPDGFIDLAEETNLLTAMTVSVLRQACVAAMSWPGSPYLAINISPAMLHNPWLVVHIEGVLASTGFPAERLEIEITENATIDDVGHVEEVMRKFRDRNIRIALDDFGTGYSSLSSLANLPFDKIKIDRSFVATMADNPHSAMIVDAIVALGGSMGLSSTAEGIETLENLNAIRAAGCTYGQGYFWSKPVRAEEARALAERAQPADSGTRYRGVAA